MAMLDDVVQVLALTDPDGRLSMRIHGVQRGQVGPAFVDSHGIRCAVLVDGLFEVTPGRNLVTAGTQQEVDGVAGFVHGTIEVCPLAPHLEVGLVHAPALANRPLVTTKRLLEQRQ